METTEKYKVKIILCKEDESTILGSTVTSDFIADMISNHNIHPLEEILSQLIIEAKEKKFLK